MKTLFSQKVSSIEDFREKLVVTEYYESTMFRYSNLIEDLEELENKKQLSIAKFAVMGKDKDLLLYIYFFDKELNLYSTVLEI